MIQIIIIVFHYYNIYTLLCASTSCLISHDARIIPSSTERSCITIEHSYYKKILITYLTVDQLHIGNLLLKLSHFLFLQYAFVFDRRYLDEVLDVSIPVVEHTAC